MAKFIYFILQILSIIGIPEPICGQKRQKKNLCSKEQRF